METIEILSSILDILFFFFYIFQFIFINLYVVSFPHKCMKKS
jgi:hypothetical protein